MKEFRNGIGLDSQHRININDYIENIQAMRIQQSWMAHAYHLRHEVFAKELRWVPRNNKGIEFDVYDGHAEHFGVFRNTSILSYLRLVTPSYGYMLEKEFSNLVSPYHSLRKEDDTREVSRLCVKSDERSTKVQTEIGPVGLSILLYQSVYNWCIQSKVRYLYLVVEYKVYRLLRIFGFPCMQIGNPTEMPDGVVAVAAMMDWREFEDTNERKEPVPRMAN